MKISTYSMAICASLIFLGISCSVQDHVAPSLKSCRTIQESRYDASNTSNTETFDLNGRKVVMGKGQVFLYEHDDQGRVIKYTTRFGNSDLDLTVRRYEYFPTYVKVYDYEIYGMGPTSWETIYPLSEQGNIIEPDSSPTKYTYDSNGYLTQLIYSDGIIDNYTIKDGNVAKWERVDPKLTPSLLFTTEYEYDITKFNPVPTYSSLRGKLSRNLVIKTTTRQWDASISQYKESVYVPTYIFSENGQVKYTYGIEMYYGYERISLTKYDLECQ